MSAWRRCAVPGAIGVLIALGFVTFAVLRKHESHQHAAKPAGAATVTLEHEPTASEQCLNRRAQLEQRTTMPGTPNLDTARAEIVARARSAQVLFVDAPQPGSVSERIGSLRKRLFEGNAPWPAFHQAYVEFLKTKSALRQVILTDGYLYAEHPEAAALLGNHVVLNHLFDAKELVITRGDQVLHATKKGLDYFWKDGPDAGNLARLWLFDRVSAQGETLGPTRHVSLDHIREQTGADRFEIERLTTDGILARLFYGEVTVPAVLTVRDDGVNLECEALDAQSADLVQAARVLARRRRAVLSRMRDAIDAQITEALPFDEPKTEEGQQDGKLRQQWREAYLQGQYSFEFNGDKYSIFGAHGHPRLPQVCVDFVVDTWERMAGTRWLGRDEGRGRKVGRIDFNALDIENRRSVDRLIDFARNKPEWFDVIEIPEAERVPFHDRARFFKRLFANQRDFQPGDVVAILGMRDDERLHYHSFIIVSDDPLTGMPTAVAANAGRPRIRSWEAEMQNAPRRSIIARIRPHLPWLEALADTNAREPHPNSG
jgi:hypothetical protein